MSDMGFNRREGACFSFCLVLAVVALVHLVYTDITRRVDLQSIAAVDRPPKQTFTVQNVPQYKKRFPKAIIIGVGKSGTSALRDILRCHPSIEMADGEVVYFSRWYGRHNLKWYIQQMPPSTNDEITMEKSPGYFHKKSVPQRLFKVSKDVKLLLIVRNPLVRAVSEPDWRRSKHGDHHSFAKKVLLKDGTINQNRPEIFVSMYDIHYKNWLKWFPRKQILIVDDDNLKVNPSEELGIIEKFLHIPHFFSNNQMFHYDNISHRYYLASAPKKMFGNAQNSHNFTALPKLVLKQVASFLQPHAQEFCRVALANFTWCTDVYHGIKL